MTPADTQAALAAATATLESPGDPLAWLHARDVVALVACVSALRDVLTQTERERDEARARIARYCAATDAAAIAQRTAGDEYFAALAALRETPAGEGER